MFAAEPALIVEDGGDFGVGVVVQEPVDLGDDLGECAALFPGALGDRQGQGAVLAAGQADVGGDGVVGAGDGDVGDQQSGDAFAFPGGGGRVVPDRGWVAGQLGDAGLLRVGELPGVGVAGGVVGLLGVAQGS